MEEKKRIYALGFFDGVHVGHQVLLRRCRELARQFGCESAAITFDAHPQSLFSKDPPALLGTVQDRLRLLRHYGMDRIDCFPVTKEVMSTPWEDFLEMLLSAGAAGFVCGYDFHFGFRGEGTAEKLEEFCRRRCLPCVIIPEQTLKGQRISSTLIRGLIEQGRMDCAVSFLGHPHMLTGTVRHGQQLGRRLGIPTANLVIPGGVVVPKFGVYACRAVIGEKSWPAVANVGIRPTVSGSGITVEPWILDYSGDLYDREITLEIHKFLREETKFPDLSALQQQIRLDAEQTRHYFETCQKIGS